jgi:hypothetical protein
MTIETLLMLLFVFPRGRDLRLYYVGSTYLLVLKITVFDSVILMLKSWKLRTIESF